MKSICKFVLLFLLAVSALGVTAIANEIAVTIDGRAVNFADQPPTVIDNRTLVPVRGVFEHLGFYVSWDGDAQQATLTREDFTVIISVGSATFTTNGVSHTLDVPAQIINNRTMLPIRAVLESVGVGVDWDGGTTTVLIFTAPVIVIVTPTPETAAPAAPATPTGNAQPGEILQFGGQDWLVLYVCAATNHAKILRKLIIPNQPYHHSWYDITWEHSSSRAWLNGEFFNSFSATDQARIRETHVVNNDNPWTFSMFFQPNHTPGGNNTHDKIFSLSIEEVTQFFGGRDLIELGRDESNRNGSILGLNAGGIWEGDEISDSRIALNSQGWTSWWFLRSPGDHPSRAAIVHRDGGLSVSGSGVHQSFNHGGLRPALWLNLES